MPLSLTPKRAAEILIVCDEPAVGPAFKLLPTQSLDWKKVTLVLESIKYLKTEFDVSVPPRVTATGRGNSIA